MTFILSAERVYYSLLLPNIFKATASSQHRTSNRSRPQHCHYCEHPMPRRPERYRPITAATAAGVFSFVLPTASFIQLYRRTGSLLPVIYTGLVSAATFVLYGYDKLQARNLQWRVRETTLHTLELLGGWPGAMLGQHYFQHKTKKVSFQLWFWAIVIGWQGLWWTIWRGGITVQ